jgi:HJR/Mrr/RecB family endonuclease
MAKRKTRRKSTTEPSPIILLALIIVVLLVVFNVSVTNSLLVQLLVYALLLAGGILWYGKHMQDKREQAMKQWLLDKGYQQDFASLSPLELETLVSVLYEELGYETKLTPRSGDDGIDVIALKNGKKTVIQVKQSIHPVGSPVIQTLYGSMAHALADKAICVSTSGFTTAAEQFAAHKTIELIDAKELTDLIRSVSRQ